MLRARRSAVLDAVLDNFRLARRELAGAERERLDAHEDKVLQLEQRIRGGVGACTPPSWTEPGGYDLLYDDDLSAPILTDIAVSALSCDYARVVTVEFANGHDHAFDWLWGVNGGPIVDTSAYDNWHAMVHADFQDGLRDLMKCKTIQQAYWGTPADTHREVVDRSYGYSITVQFATLADHDAYQEDPDHDRFIERCSQYWSRVQVYDAATHD